jgi:hypothetical protein
MLLQFYLHRRITRTYVKWAIQMSAETQTNVTDLHEWKSNTATYQDFYTHYAVARAGGSIILNRVLDTNGDTSTHLIVGQGKNPGGYMVPMRPHPNNETPLYRVSYNPRETWFATTDGQTISTYHVRSAFGTFRGSIDRPYTPVDERIQIDFVSTSTSEVGKIDFNLGTGNGVFALGERALGWILGAEESAHLRVLALAPDDHPPIHGAVA